MEIPELKEEQPIINQPLNVCIYENVLNGTSSGLIHDIWRIKIAGLVVASYLVFITVFWSLIMFFPFVTVQFIGDPPIRIINAGKKIPLGGTVQMSVLYRKFTNAPGLVVMTLVGKNEFGQLITLDSTTSISMRLHGQGESYPVFDLTVNKNNIGKDRQIVFSIYHTLFGVRPVLTQYWSEPFEITPPLGEQK